MRRSLPGSSRAASTVVSCDGRPLPADGSTSPRTVRRAPRLRGVLAQLRPLPALQRVRHPGGLSPRSCEAPPNPAYSRFGRWIRARATSRRAVAGRQPAVSSGSGFECQATPAATVWRRRSFGWRSWRMGACPCDVELLTECLGDGSARCCFAGESRQEVVLDFEMRRTEPFQQPVGRAMCGLPLTCVPTSAVARQGQYRVIAHATRSVGL